MFLRKEIQPILGEEVVKYVSLTINGGKVLNGSKIKHNGLNNQKLKIARNLIKKREKIKEILATTLTIENIFDKLLSKFLLLKTLRVLRWISRFLSNSRKHSLKGPLTTNELLKQRKLIIRKIQLQYVDIETFKINKKHLHVKVSEEGLYQCFGRIQGKRPIFIPKESVPAQN